MLLSAAVHRLGHRILPPKPRVGYGIESLAIIVELILHQVPIHDIGQLASGRRKRLATFSAGMAFGEMAALDRAPRSATILADTEAECDVLALEDFTALGNAHPQIKIRMLENLALGLSRKLRKANRELTVLE